LLVKVPGITISVNREEKRRELFKNPLVYLFVGAVTFSFLGEAVIYTWFISYMRISYGFEDKRLIAEIKRRLHV
jgi:predicted MFS family arabinose efflux permease